MTRAYLMAGSGTVAPRRPARSLAVGLGGQSAGAGGLPCSRTGDGPPPAALGSSAGFRGATLFRCGLAPPLQLSLAWSPRDLATVFRHLGPAAVVRRVSSFRRWLYHEPARLTRSMAPPGDIGTEPWVQRGRLLSQRRCSGDRLSVLL